MAQPRAYSITTNFNDYSATNPSDPHPGSKFDTEFTEIKQNTDDLNTNIALLQRDDGKLNNEAVHKDAFDQDALALIGLSGYTVRGAWATATAYAVGDIVTNNEATYLNSTAHTSGTFSTDTANWTLLANAAINVTGHSVDTFNGVGTVQLSGSTWASGAAAITYTSTVLTPAVGMHITHASFPTGTKVQSIDTTNKIVTADTNSTAAASAPNEQVVDLGRGFTLSFSYSSDTDFQVFIAGQLTSPTLFAVSGTTLTFTSAPAVGTGNIIIWGGGAAVEATKSQVTTYRDDALDHRDTTIDYATRTGAVVRTFSGATNNVSDTSPTPTSPAEYSAKEHAEGTFVPEGSAKLWASKDTTAVAGGNFSAKEYATGVAASTGGSAKDYAQYTGGGVRGETGDHSAKACAVGGTGVTTTSGKGSAKDWATKDDGVVDTADFSAKAYASVTGSNAPTDGSAKEWATTLDAFITGTLASSKEYAQGDGNSDAVATGGSAKGWAQDAAKVNGATTNDRSAKAWSQGASMTGATLQGSAKDWAQLAEDSPVDGTNFSAKHWAAKATTTYDNFDDRFLGAHTTAEREVGSGNIGKDHDGDALVSGALYFDTTLGVMKVWNGSLWKQLTPTSTEQTNIDTIVTGYDGTAGTSGTTTNLSLINTVKLNLVDVNNFATRYRTGDTDPTTSKDDGDLFWNTNTDELKIYNTTAAAWQVPYLDSASVNAEATNAAISMAIALG